MSGFPVKSVLAKGGGSNSLPGVGAELSLILETSTRLGSAVLADSQSGAMVASRDFESDRNHNAALFGPLKSLFGEIGDGTISRVIVGTGPGSYSGTRVGIAAAQGIAIAAGCPVVALPSLTGLCNPAPASLAIGDARRGHWWWVPMRQRHMQADAPELGDAGELQRAIGAALSSGREIFSFENPVAFANGVAVTEKTPSAAGLWEAWQEADPAMRQSWEDAPVQPCYLKPPHITAPKRPWLQA